MKSQILQVSVPIFVVLASIVPALPQKSIPDLVEEIKPSVVTIITFDADGEMLGQGSGFFAGHYVFAENDQEPESESNSIPLIISNRHVFEGAYSAEVTMFDGVSFPVWMIDAEYKELDLILVVPMILRQSSLKGFLEYLGQLAPYSYP